MKVVNYREPKSSFLSIDKDLNTIIDLLFKNQRLDKLLYYNTQDCLTRSDLSEAEIASLFGKQIKIVPKLYVDNSVFTYLIISFDNFVPSNNPEFRDNIIEFDIICHFDQWQLKDLALRPYKIAAELDSTLAETKLSNLGKLEFISANQIILTDEYAGLCLFYNVVHGKEDKIDAPNPIENNNFQNNFNNMFNN